MSGDSKFTQTAVPDPRDLIIAEQARVIAEQAEQIRNLEEKLKNLEDKLAKLEALLASAAEVKSSKTPVFTENYSLDRNKTCEKKPTKKSTGRKPAAAKRHLVTGTIKVFADGVDPAECIRHRSQFAWRIVDGKAVKKLRVKSPETRV